jgi:glycosyltransferase involved in cell wall biosynthesis
MRILAFPRDANPYQELLYGPMRAEGVDIAYFEGPTASHTLNVLLWPLLLIYRRLQGYTVFHMHWTFLFSLPWAGRFGAVLMQLYFSCFLWELKLLGYRVVWTAHNTKPHEGQFARDHQAYKLLVRLSSLVIAHTPAALQQLAAQGMTPTHSIHIPHGNYIGTYPDTISRAAARKQLQLPADKPVLLCFGLIRAYKGIETLLDAFASLPENNRPYLIIAGEPLDAALAARIRSMATAMPQLRPVLRHITDTDLQTYFRAADFAVLPYAQATTSGVALLACSFGTPLITPAIAAFDDIPAAARLTYQPGQLAATFQAATATTPARRRSMQTAATAYARTLDWPTIARQTIQAMEAVS